MIVLIVGLLSQFSQAEMLQLSDIGFHGEDIFLSMKPDYEQEQAGKVFYTFGLCRTSDGKCHKLNSCKYQRSKLRNFLNKYNNEKFAEDLYFFTDGAPFVYGQSGFSSLEIRPFINNLIKVLLKSNPNCTSFDLSILPPHELG